MSGVEMSRLLGEMQRLAATRGRAADARSRRVGRLRRAPEVVDRRRQRGADVGGRHGGRARARRQVRDAARGDDRVAEGEPVVPGDDRGAQPTRQRVPRNHEHADLVRGSRNPWPIPTVLPTASGGISSAALRTAAASREADPAARRPRGCDRGGYRDGALVAGRELHAAVLRVSRTATSARSRRSSIAPTFPTRSTPRRAACSCRPIASTRCGCSSRRRGCRAAPASASRRCQTVARSARRRSWRTRCTCGPSKPSSRARSAACSRSRWRACISRCRRSRCSCGRNASRALR